MKEKQNKRWGLLLISFLCAFLVWLGVVNVADPVMTDTVEVPVEIINSDVLTKNNLTYEVIGKSTTTVQYEIKTTDAYRIRSSDFRAYADMTDMWSVTGAIPIKIEVLNHSEYLVSTPVSRTGTIKIETEPLQRKTFTIGVTTTGMLEDGYQTGKVTLSPETLTVEGPESLIGQISSVGIEISLDGKNADWSDSEEPKFYDANNNSITISDRLISNCKSVDYTMEILKVKNLNLDFDVTGEVASGYRYTGVECELKSVPVVGLKSALASLNTITIPKDELDVSGAKANIVRTIDLNDYLPDGVSLAGMSSSEITVTLTVEQLKEREYTVRVDSDCYAGANSAYSYQSDPSTVTVRVRALQEELDSLQLAASDLSLNVSGMGEGSHQVQPELSRELDSAYDLLGISSCTVNISRKQETGTEAEPETTAEETTKAPETVSESSKEAETEEDSNVSQTRHAVIIPPETTEAHQATGLQTLFRN